MPIIVVTSNNPGAGKTGVAAAIARHFAYLGTPVRVARLSGEPGTNEREDATYFGSLPFVPGTASEPAQATALGDPGEGQLLVVEAPASLAATIPNARVVFVARDAMPSDIPAGITPAAVVITDVDGLRGARIASESGPRVIELGEDRTLAGFSVSEAKAAINAETIVPGDAGDPTCDYLVVAPIASDAGQPYFRRFDSKAVVVRFDKTDMHLAAMQAAPQCLILTGGRMPSDYLFDAASAKGIPVLLSRTDTENTVIALEGIFDHTRFQGERKLDRMAELLAGTGLYELLG